MSPLASQDYMLSSQNATVPFRNFLGGIPTSLLTAVRYSVPNATRGLKSKVTAAACTKIEGVGPPLRYAFPHRPVSTGWQGRLPSPTDLSLLSPCSADCFTWHF